MVDRYRSLKVKINMKLHIMSDLHFSNNREDHPELVAAVFNAVQNSTADVLCIVGDVGNTKRAYQDVLDLKDMFALGGERNTIYVPGNHEYFGGSIAEGRATQNDVLRSEPNLMVLDNQVGVVNGQRFLGSTLWYSQPNYTMWSDFEYINSWYLNNREEFYTARNFLDENLQEGDVVLTHMLPSWRCVAPRYGSDPNNQFFVNNVEPLFDRKPKLWCHGHTHTANDFILDSTRVVCNPLGTSAEPNGFDFNKIVDI